jgi:hypothetical protein
MIQLAAGQHQKTAPWIFERSPAAAADGSGNFTVRGLTIEPG